VGVAQAQEGHILVVAKRSVSLVLETLADPYPKARHLQKRLPTLQVRSTGFIIASTSLTFGIARQRESLDVIDYDQLHSDIQKVMARSGAATDAAISSTADLESILDGDTLLGISHSGGELKNLVDSVGQPPQ
jgi:hypothetical protein